MRAVVSSKLHRLYTITMHPIRSIRIIYYSLMKKIARAPSARTDAGTDHEVAPACMFSKGLPLPLAAGFVACEPPLDDVGVEPDSGVVGLGDAAPDDGEAVELA